ncbi:U6 snRNA-associated Sm-like protein LSm8 isoform X1 [Clavelina lepadiformis]|uniref:U6 snRNA-associated Sm-like protein LSm8 isoform X1 n=1 Tax=Clavelina lepadiformis TaxID=159417 RepID=UPI0040413522
MYKLPLLGKRLGCCVHESFFQFNEHKLKKTCMCIIVMKHVHITLYWTQSQAYLKMASALEPLVNRVVSVITADGRMIVGTLKGFDQTVNLILDESHERVFSSTQGVEQVMLGLYIIRGDNVAVIGEVDDTTDAALDLENMRAAPLNAVVH